MSQFFTDTAGRVWTIEITVGALKRVKTLTDVDLTKLLDPESRVAAQLSDDVVLLFDVVTALLAPQLDTQGITIDQFGDALDEEAAEGAALAMFEAVINFFRPDKRNVINRAFQRVRKVTEQQRTTAIQTALEQLETPEFEMQIQNSIAGSLSANSPESLESIRTPGHSENSSTPPKPDNAISGTTQPT